MANAEGVKCVLAAGGVARQCRVGECEYVLNGLQGAAGKVAQQQQQQQQSSGRRQSPKTVHNSRQMPRRVEAGGMWHGVGRHRNGEYVS